jgi:hypothetical protein
MPVVIVGNPGTGSLAEAMIGPVVFLRSYLPGSLKVATKQATVSASAAAPKVAAGIATPSVAVSVLPLGAP